jgi:L-threonylcarbamoyladenylate synthase
VLTISVEASGDLDRALAPAAAALERGGVVAYPTDTLYGLAVDPRDRGAVARLFSIKARHVGHAVPLIAADAAQIAAVGVMTDMAHQLAKAFWPGPLTIVIRAVPAMERAAIDGETQTVAVRVPAHPIARTLAHLVGHPITATSANLSGQPAAVDADQVRAAFGDRLDALVDGGAARGGPPSTIVDVTGAAPRLVRPGAIDWERVLRSFS